MFWKELYNLQRCDFRIIVVMVSINEAVCFVGCQALERKCDEPLLWIVFTLFSRFLSDKLKAGYRLYPDAYLSKMSLCVIVALKLVKSIAIS